MHDVTVTAGASPGNKAARAAGEVAFGSVIVAVTILPLAFSGLTPSSGDVKPLALSILVAVGLLAWLVAGAARGELTWPRTRVNLAGVQNQRSPTRAGAARARTHGCVWSALRPAPRPVLPG